MQTRLGAWYNYPYSGDVAGYNDLELESLVYKHFYSENHRRLGNGWSGGGTFISEKIFTRYSPSVAVSLAPGGYALYDGRLTAPVPNLPEWVKPPALEGYGAEVYRQAKPDHGLMNLGNSLYELKDVPGMLRDAFNLVRDVYTSRGRHLGSLRLRDIANYDLAVTFGWLPLLGDVVSFYEAQRQLQKKLEQLLRDNGRPVRRNFQVDRLSSASEEILMSGSHPVFTDLSPTFVDHNSLNAGGEWTISSCSTTKVWFSGKFKYYLPPKGLMTENQWKRSLVRRLFGLRPTPSRIYKAIPWSWLIDWCTNVGDILANLETEVVDSLYNEYAYLMRTVEQFTRYKVTGRYRSGGHVQTATAVTEHGYSLKERVRASPFGFRLKTEDLSPYQLNILAALKAKGL